MLAIKSSPKSRNALAAQRRLQMPFHLMLLPGVIILLIYSYLPMAGLFMAFQHYVPAKGIFRSSFNALDNFKFLFTQPSFFSALYNTVFIAILKIAGNLVVPIIFTLLLNEVRVSQLKKSIQTIIYLPHFMSWIILGGILLDVLSPSSGVVSTLFKAFGLKPVYFMGDLLWARAVLIVSDIWKEFGFNTIIYLAALTNIDPTYYQAAEVDGAGRWKQTIHVTLPGILPIIILMTVLSMGSILNAGFEQVFTLYSAQVYKTTDILDTMIYRVGMIESQYGIAAALGLLKSVVGLVFIATSYKLADKYANYSIF